MSSAVGGRTQPDLSLRDVPPRRSSLGPPAPRQLRHHPLERVEVRRLGEVPVESRVLRSLEIFRQRVAGERDEGDVVKLGIRLARS
jgi:hypothetical protein